MKPLTVAWAVVLLLSAGGARAAAQGVASSFDQLSVLVKPGDKITLVDVSGTEAEGRIGRLSRDKLTLLTDRGLREVGEADVATIRQRRGDSLKNGAVIGAVAATAYFLTIAAILGDSDGGGVIVSRAIVGGLWVAGTGAAAGAGIDALIKGRQLIYQKPSGGSSVSISPLFGHGRRGAAIVLKF